MGNIKEIVIGLVLFLLTSLLAYLFRMRQLYLSSPKLYKKSSLSSNGGLCEVKVFNRGNHSEEEISVSFDPGLSVELLATDCGELSVKDNKISISRLHKLKDASAVLLVEGGEFETNKIISFSSKATDGKILKSDKDVPFNYAIGFTLISLMIFLLPAIWFGFGLVRDARVWYAKHQLQSVIQKGWVDIGNYYSSDIRDSYSDFEFPISIKEAELMPRGDYSVAVELYNKTAAPLDFTIDSGSTNAGKAFDSAYYRAVTVAPMSKSVGTFLIPAKDSSPYHNVEFTITCDKGYQCIAYGIAYRVEYAKLPEVKVSLGKVGTK